MRISAHHRSRSLSTAMASLLLAFLIVGCVHNDGHSESQKLPRNTDSLNKGRKLLPELTSTRRSIRYALLLG